MTYTPKTGAACSCKRGVQRDNCPTCEGTGQVIDFAAIHARRYAERETLALCDGWPFDRMAEHLKAGRFVWLHVTEEQSDYALNVLPPLYVPHGFAIGEPNSDDAQGRTVYAFYTKAGGEWWATYTTREQFDERRRGLVRKLQDAGGFSKWAAGAGVQP